jgi:hypothetical protein
MMRAFGLSVLIALGVVLSASDARAVSLKNFRELAAFYSSATGIAMTEPRVAAAYLNVKSRLPKAGTVDEFSSPSVLGAVELSSAFCGAFISVEAAAQPANRRAHQTVDFTKSPRVLVDGDIMAAIKNYARLFWQRELKADEDKVLLASVTRLKALSTDNAAGTRQLFLATCTQVATSLDALINR